MHQGSSKGSIVLVALSCVAVLGIATVAFLAVSNPAMRLSHRAYLKVVSKNLAEAGLERAMRSFNTGDFVSGGAWTINSATATANLTFSIPSSRYTTSNTTTSNITTSVKVRVDHYLDRASRKATIWSPLPTYAVNDYVWYQGVWYLCTAVPAARQAPSNTAYWKAAPDNWNPYANYRIGNIVLSGGSAYTCIADHIGQVPPNANWTVASVAAWSSATTYVANDVVFSGGVSYRCLTGHTNQAPPNPTYWLSAPVIYSEGVASVQVGTGDGVVSMPITTQLRATLAPAPLFPNALGATKDVNFSGTSYIDSYNSVTGNYSASNRGAQAVVAGGDTAASNAVALSSSRVFGYVAATSNNTSPYAPRMTKSTSGFVTGNLSATSSSAHDLTRITRSPHVPRFDIQGVTGAYALPNGGTVLDNGTTTLGTAGASTPQIYNITGALGSSDPGLCLEQATDILEIEGPVILKVGGKLRTDRGRILVKETGSLEIYFTDELEIEARSTNGIENLTLDPKKCLLVGTMSSTSSSLNYFRSSRPFYGVIYMPDAYPRTATTALSSPAKTNEIFGAISGYYVGIPAANVWLHYDTSLRTAGAIGTFIDAPYITTEVRELSDASERVTLP